MLLRCIHWVIVCGMVVLLQTCNTDKTDDPVLDTAVEKEYQLDLWEALSNNTRTFQIRASTIEQKECLNYNIESSISRKINNIEINLVKPYLSTACEPGAGPAKSTLDLNTLSNGIYNVTVKIGKVIPSNGRLIVSNGSYFLSLPDPIGFRLGFNTLLRIPDQTIWGYVGYEAGQQRLVNQFFADLMALTQDAELPRGYYGYFNLSETGNVEFGGQVSTDRPIQPILRHFSGTDKDLEALLKQYRDKYGSILLIRLRNTAGKEF